MSTKIAQLAWTQAMMTHRFTTEAHSKALFQRACDLSKITYSDEAYLEMITEVSEQFITYASLDIRRAQDEHTGRSIIAIVNTEGDAISQGATTYTAQELSYIKRVIRAIFTSSDEAYSIFATRALGECNKIKPSMTKKAAEELLNHLVSRGWLVYHEGTGAYALSTRACLELQAYLKAEYEDFVLTCTYCSAMVTRGVACAATEECPVRYHHHCVVNLPRRGGQKCPECKEPWQSAPVGRESIGSGRKPTADGLFSDDEEDTTQAQTQTQRRSNARRTSRGEDEEDEAAETDEEEGESNQLDELDEFGDVNRRRQTEAAQPPRKSGRASSGRANAKRRKQMEDAGDDDDDGEMEE